MKYKIQQVPPSNRRNELNSTILYNNLPIKYLKAKLDEEFL